MANTKDYAFREMIYDQCFSTGKEFTCKQLMDIVNRKLEERAMKLIQSRTTFWQDMIEMNGKFNTLYGKDGIVYEDRNKKRYYRYRYGIDSIYNHELTEDEVEKLQQVRSILQGFNGMPDFGWIDQMLTRLDQNMMGRQKEIASFEGGTKKDAILLMPLFDAINKRQVLDVEYRKDYRDSETIILHPYYLKQYWRRWYLMAMKEGGNDIEAFSLDRMDSVKVNKEVKYKATKTSFKKYFEHLVGVTVPQEPKVEHIELWADSSLFPYLISSPIHSSQKIVVNEEGNYSLTLDVMINYELIQELMFYGDRLVVTSPAFLRDHMIERLEWCKESYKNVEGAKLNIEAIEPELFAFNYIHDRKDEELLISYRISLGTTYLESSIFDMSIDWNYIRTRLEKIVNHSHTVIELGNEEEPTKIELKKVGDMLDIEVTPNRQASKDGFPFNGHARCKDVVRELYHGLLEMANAYPQEYVDGCPFTQDVVRRALKSEIIENYLREN